MTKRFNICIIQPEGYIHSAALFETAGLLKYSLKDLGHEASITYNNINKSCRKFIF